MRSPLSALIVKCGKCKMRVPHRETAGAWRMPCPNRLTDEDMRSEPICKEKQGKKINAIKMKEQNSTLWCKSTAWCASRESPAASIKVHLHNPTEQRCLLSAAMSLLSYTKGRNARNREGKRGKEEKER